MNLHTQHRVRFSFHTWESNGFDTSVLGGLRLPFRVQGFNYTKAFGSASGQFSITLKATEQDAGTLLDLWKDPEGVWMKIQYLINGQSCDVLLGNIDTIKESTRRQGQGERSVSLAITGRDHGKVFENTETFVNIFERDGRIPQAVLYDAFADDVQGRPDEIIRALIRTWLGNNEVSDSIWTLPPSLFGGRRFFDVLNRSTISRRTRGELISMQLLNPSSMQGQLWDAMQEWSNGLLNEMWTDLAPDPKIPPAGLKDDPVTRRKLAVRALVGLTPAVYLRERPFPTRVENANRRRWDRLPTHDIYPWEVSAKELTKGGGQNKHNFWILDAMGAQGRGYGTHARVAEETGGEAGEPGNIPIYDLDSIRKFGLRRFQQGTRFLPFNEASIAEIAYATSAQWLQLVHDWYAVAPLERTGTITVARAMPWIRIGHRIKLHERSGPACIYYVEGIAHSYSYPGAASTTLTVTRGEPEDRDYLDELYEAREEGHSDTTGALENVAPGLGAASETTASSEQLEAVREAPDAATARAAAEAIDGVPSTPETTQDADAGAGFQEPADMEFIINDEGEAVVASEGDSQSTDPDMNQDDLLPENDGFQSLPERNTTQDGSERSGNLVRQDDIDIDPTTTTPNPQEDN